MPFKKLHPAFPVLLFAFTAALAQSPESQPARSYPDSVLTGITYRVNCGGGAYTDPRGNHWEADAHFVGGGTVFLAGKIKGSDLVGIYRSERYNDPAKTPLKYTFPEPAGTYSVRLMFAEIYPGYPVAGKRIFSVFVNGNIVLKDFDIAALVGVDSALVKEYQIDPVGGNIEVTFTNKVDHAKISGIEIIPKTSTGFKGPESGIEPKAAKPAGFRFQGNGMRLENGPLRLSQGEDALGRPASP